MSANSSLIIPDGKSCEFYTYDDVLYLTWLQAVWLYIMVMQMAQVQLSIVTLSKAQVPVHIVQVQLKIMNKK